MATYELRTHKGEPYLPLPTQLRFHQSTARYKSYIGYLAAGKSLCGSVEALLTAIEKPGYRPGKTLICRGVFADLVDSTWETFTGVVKETCPALIKDEKRSSGDLRLTLKNGWEFIGRHLTRWQAFGSMDLVDYVWIDEVNDEEVGMDAYNMLCGRIGRGLFGQRVWCTGNPAGKNWNYDLFFKHLVEGGRPRKDHDGFQPGPEENVHLPQSYWEDLRAFYPDAWVKKFLEGSFDVYEGQIFENLDYSLHTVEPFKVPDEWPRYFGLDHGWTHPTAGIWAAMDFDGNLYVYREYYKSCAVPAANVKAMLDMEVAAGETEGMIQWRVIDKSTQQVQSAAGIAQRIEEQYREAGMHCQLSDGGPGSVLAGISRIKTLMQPDPAHLFPRWHALAGEYNAPNLYIFRDCKALLSEMQQYQWKSVKPGQRDRETPLSKSDDAIAALRYLIMRAPKAPVVRPTDPHQWLKAALAEMEGRKAGRELESPKNLIGA